MSKSTKPFPKGRTGPACLPTQTSSATSPCCFRPTGKSLRKSVRPPCLRPCARSRTLPTRPAKQRRMVGLQLQPPRPPTTSRAASRPRTHRKRPLFEPDLFASPTPADRRRFTRMKCNVAVEIRVEGAYAPIWGNLVNVGRGGCLVETARVVPSNKALEIGLWVASGKIWVKGVVINGISSGSTTSSGARVQFSRAQLRRRAPARVPQVCRRRSP